MSTPPTACPEIPGLTDLSMLAVGGYATIFRAVQGTIGREVAVKVENRTLESDADQARFLREARAAGRMSSHPHVVDLFDAGVTEDNHPYLIMELCVGSYQDQMPLRPHEVRDVGVKIADALADAHERGIVHRDVKPANILISHFAEPALADFGLSILAELRDPHVTLDVMTPAYAPPEAFRRADPAPAGDVYALCATLYAMLRGAPPRWEHDQPPGLTALIELFATPVPDVFGVPDQLVTILRAGLDNDPAARPTARALEELLAAVDLDHAAPPRRGSAGPAGARGPAGAGSPAGRAGARGPAGPTGAGDVAPDLPTVPVQTRSRLGNLIDNFFRR